MNQMTKKILSNTGLCTVLALTALMLLSLGSASAQVKMLDDGALQNSYGGFDLPLQGSCWGDGAVDPTKPTRPLCTALRLNYATSPLCVAGVSPNVRSWSSSLCNDVDPAVVDQTTCESKGDRLWNASTSKCAIVMSDDDRNGVVCALHGGTYQAGCTGSWVMPNGNAYNPPLLNAAATSPGGAGDQCLRCHNTRTQYNGPRVRDTEDTMFMGHKNMSRKVTVGTPWGGPDFHCVGGPLAATATSEEACFDLGFIYNWVPLSPYLGTDSGQDFNWTLGTVDIGTLAVPNPRSLYWIYADWLAAYPRAIYHDVADTTVSPNKPKVAYSCARCHTTGWTADATLKVNKEPHKSFLAEAPVGSNPATGTASIVWDGVSDAVAGQVSLKPGTPFTENMASWDAWGITCTRCHASAVDLASNGGFPPMVNPAGMSTHHNNLTPADFPSGCSLFNSQCPGGRCQASNCATNGGTWYYGYCTDSRIIAGNGNLPAAAKTACETGGPFGTAPATGTGFGIWVTPCSDNNFATAATCVTPNTWNLPTSSCSVAGVCSKGTCSNPLYTNYVNCTDNLATWTPITTSGACTTAGGMWQAAGDVIACDDAGGHWTGSYTQRGQIITSLCMNCHRQEASGVPMDSTSPATAIKVGPYHGSVGFVSHPHSNQFLNSPHAKFTGTFAQVPTGKFKGYLPGEYNSYFMADGEAANTGNGCTGCHDVHTSVVAGEKPFAEECTECHNKDLGSMNHSGGAGTPLEEMATDPMEACVICHMPAGEHLFRINVDPLYATKPATALTATVNANTAPDGNYPNAVWVDLDSACGKCHGGGVANVETTGSMTTAAATLTVATGQGGNFTVGQRVEVTGAGAVYYEDGIGHPKNNNDFESYIVSISGDVLTLAGKPTKSVTNTAVAQNPVKNNAAYFTKTELAVKAAGIHNDKPYVNFSFTLTPGNTLQLNVDASTSTCSGSLANCDAFVWNWDDATPNTTTGTPTASHTYAAAGTYLVTLTVREYGVSEGSATRKVRTYAVDAPPVAGGTACASIINPNTWVGTLVDNSTDPTGVKQVVVKWGDGGVNSSAIDNTPPYSLIGTVFTRTYLNAATVSIKQTAYDTIGQANV
ncbi:MAG: PKD domain-containing protein, partial [Thermoanaerobaculia bacterium]